MRSAAASLLFSFACFASAEAEPVAVFAIPERLDELAAETDRLQSEIAKLPSLNDSLQFDAYGYHGGYLPRLESLPDQPRWTVEVAFIDYLGLRQIVLVPATDHRFDRSRSYGFPKRFRVSQVFQDAPPNLVAEWMEADCPEPGRMPLSIDLPDPRSNRIRIEVFRGSAEGNQELFALDEIFGIIAERLIHRGLEVQASSELESLPYWSKQFLIDQKTSLGLPLGAPDDASAPAKHGEFYAVFDTDSNAPSVIEIDLGTNRDLGWIELFPAMPPEGIMIPGYGFPGSIDIDTILDLGNGKRAEARRDPDGWRSGNPGNNIVRLSAHTKSARWIRLSVSDLPVINGKRTFAMGEFNVHRKGVPFPIQSIALEGFPPTPAAKIGLMSDGLADGRPIRFMADWLKEVEQRNQLALARENVAREIENLKFRQNDFWDRARSVSIATVLLGALITAIVASVQRRRHAKQLRRQISSDLHDDIGSKVAAISLAATYVERNGDQESVRVRGRRIQTIATAMHHGLRDVLWFSDTRTDTLDQLAHKLADCARVGVEEDRLSLKVTPPRRLPNRTVNVQTKRDLLLFFREAISNASKHSGASQINVEISAQGRWLDLLIQDNGKGFETQNDQTGAPEHHGLRSMRARGKRLNARLTIKSEPGAGTTVKLSAPV